MNTKYTLKNFRVFDEQGATFELAPVTILTGCNSSGKSSATKSMMLLRPLMQRYKREIAAGTFGGFDGTGFASHLLDFTRDIASHNLGNMERVLNWNSKTFQFTIAYTAHSFALGLDMDVNLIFGKPEELKEELTTLKAELQEVRIEHNGRLFYQFLSKGQKTNVNNDSSLKEDDAFVCLVDWKTELISGLHNLELGDLCSRVHDVENAIDEYAYAPNLPFVSINEMSDVLTEPKINAVRTMFAHLSYRVSPLVRKLRKKFNYNDKNVQSDFSYKWDFPYSHLIPLGHLMDELNVVPKDEIVTYAEEHFVNQPKANGEWYATSDFHKWILNIFTDFQISEFERFSEFYSFYENAFINRQFVYFGTRGKHRKHFAEGVGEEFLGSGTASKSKGGVTFDFMNQQWENLTPPQKFQCIFYCLQGFGGYEDFSAIGGSSISLPKLEILREYATLACAELIVAGEILSDSYFIELNRARQQRLYSFTDTAHFNKILDEYYNMPESVNLKSVYKEFSKEGVYHKGDFANKWISELTPFFAFEVIPAPQGIGYFINMQKELPTGEIVGVPLCDVGYGMTLLLSMLIQIETVICKYRYLNRFEIPTICVEEPESNLHPNLQSRLADIFADAVKNHPVRFILETHSEYLVRKTQVLVAQQNKKNDCVSVENPFKVYYIPQPEDGKPYELLYRKDGNFENDFGSGFYDEAAELAFQTF